MNSKLNGKENVKGKISARFHEVHLLENYLENDGKLWEGFAINNFFDVYFDEVDKVINEIIGVREHFCRNLCLKVWR